MTAGEKEEPIHLKITRVQKLINFSQAPAKQRIAVCILIFGLKYTPRRAFNAGTARKSYTRAERLVRTLVAATRARAGQHAYSCATRE